MRYSTWMNKKIFGISFMIIQHIMQSWYLPECWNVAIKSDVRVCTTVYIVCHCCMYQYQSDVGTTSHLLYTSLLHQCNSDVDTIKCLYFTSLLHQCNSDAQNGKLCRSRNFKSCFLKLLFLSLTSPLQGV